MTRYNKIILWMIIFFAGIFVGGFASQYFFNPLWTTPERKLSHMLQKLDRELHLNNSQRDKVAEILVKTHKMMMTEVVPFVQQKMQRPLLEIRETLTPQQQIQFDIIRNEIKQKVSERMNHKVQKSNLF